MKKLVFPVLLTGLLAVSCSKKEEKVVTPAETPVEQTVSTDVKSENDVTFEGTIPCADCPGIKTKLELDWEDKTFELESVYLETKEGEFKSKGTFEASEDKSFVTLKEANSTEIKVFYITEYAAYLVEKVGDKATKEEYKLSKK